MRNSWRLIEGMRWLRCTKLYISLTARVGRTHDRKLFAVGQRPFLPVLLTARARYARYDNFLTATVGSDCLRRSMSDLSCRFIGGLIAMLNRNRNVIGVRSHIEETRYKRRE